MMAIISGPMTGIIHNKPYLKIQSHRRSIPVDFLVNQQVADKTSRAKIRCFVAAGSRSRFTISAGRNQHELSYNNEFVDEPFWSSGIKEAFGGLRSLIVFLLEQPSQLKYLEWPSFQSTLKTASLTLVLVAILIVALASVDSTLGFILALLLRKPA